MGAISLNYPDDMETEIEEAMSKPLPEADMNYAQEAWDDFHRMKGYLVRAPKRKACPEWSSPTEVWLLALLPKWRLNAPSGLGYEAIPEQWHQFRVKVVQLLTHIRRTKRVPVKWILSRGWQIGKSNGKMGIPGTRTMHGFDSLSKAFFSSALKRGAQGDEGWVPWTCPYWNHGYEAHKTRDDSVAVQDIVSYRLQKQGFSFLTESHDGTNAFQCSNVQCLNYVIDTLYRPSDRALVHQRVFYGACLIGIHGKELFMMPTTGTLQGFPSAAREFAVGYSSGLERYQAKLCSEPQGQLLLSNSPFNQDELVHVGTTVFADDTCAKTVNSHPVATDLVAQSNISRSWLAKELSDDGFVLNAEKRECLLQANWKGSSKCKRAFHDGPAGAQGKVMHLMKVLGALMKHNLGTRVEVNTRIAAGRKAYLSLGKLWYTPIPFALKRIIFMGAVDSHFHSGLMFRNLSEQELGIIDKCRVSLLRKVLQGRACFKEYDDEGNVSRYKQMTNEDVFKHSRILSTNDSLRIQRIRRYQYWAASPNDHLQVLNAFFGFLENAEKDPTILPSGDLHPQANPWAKQVYADLEVLSEVSESFRQLWEDVDRKIEIQYLLVGGSRDHQSTVQQCSDPSTRMGAVSN